MKKFILLSLIIFAFVSCQKVIEIDVDASQRQLILNAVPSADKQLFVNFAYSEFFLDTTFDHPVANSDMVVTVNGTDYHPYSQVGCNYFFDDTLREDDQLSIRIIADGQEITAQTYVPHQPQISAPVCLIDSSSTFNLLMINFDLQDHPNYKDYYRIYIQQHDSGLYHHPILDKYDTIDTVRTTFFCCLDSKLTSRNASASEALGGYFYQQLLTTDANIDGQNHSTRLIVILTRDTNEVAPYIHDYTLHIETVTPDRYQYLKDQALSSSILQLITEPAPVHSNVSGALGIFAGNAHKTFPLQFTFNPSSACKHISTIPSPDVLSTALSSLKRGR